MKIIDLFCLPFVSERAWIRAGSALLACAALTSACASDSASGTPPSDGSGVEREARAIDSLTSELEPVVSGNERLAWLLYRNDPSPAVNRFFSPFSIDAALSMTSLGAAGVTLEEMAAVLGIPADSASYHQAFGALLQDLGGEHRGRGYQLFIANRLFGQGTYPFATAFLADESAAYGAPLEKVDYVDDPEGARQTVNAWVSEQTREKLPALVPDGVFNGDTRLSLANAIYFQASFARKFDPELTKMGSFLTSSGAEKSVPLMSDAGTHRISQDELFSAVELDYADHELSLLVVMPNERGALAKLRSALDGERIANLVAGLHDTASVLALPRFEFKADLALPPILQALGMVSAFDEQSADFSKMTTPNAEGGEPLHLDTVLHQAFVHVDEQGTEAAAATVAVAATRAALATFRVDHPFVFVIRDKLTHSLLFLGEVGDPS
jgi:serpin B